MSVPESMQVSANLIKTVQHCFSTFFEFQHTNTERDLWQRKEVTLLTAHPLQELVLSQKEVVPEVSGRVFAGPCYKLSPCLKNLQSLFFNVSYHVLTYIINYY